MKLRGIDLLSENSMRLQGTVPCQRIRPSLEIHKNFAWSRHCQQIGHVTMTASNILFRYFHPSSRGCKLGRMLASASYIGKRFPIHNLIKLKFFSYHGCMAATGLSWSHRLKNVDDVALLAHQSQANSAFQQVFPPVLISSGESPVSPEEIRALHWPVGPVSRRIFWTKI